MQDIFIGRQAIFDRAMGVYAYELLYREGKTESAPRLDGDRASSQVILNAFLEMGLERIADRQPVFINLTRSFLVDLPPIPLDKKQVVLEVLENVTVDQQLIRSVAELKAKGYTLALDDFEFQPEWEPLLPYVDIIKVEVPSLDWEQIEGRVEQLHGHGIRLLAEKVETETQYRQLLELGFDYFQGYFLARPQVISGRRLSENQLVTLKLLARLNDPQVEFEELEELIGQDPGLLFKILRYLNSAALALPRKVESIRQAVVYLGLERLRAWASLIAISRVENKPQELFTVALVRAHTCAELTQQVRSEESAPAFTVGLLSVLDLLLDQPMREIVGQLPLALPVREALCHHTGIMGEALGCSLAFENLDLPSPAFPGLTPEQIQESYLNACDSAFREHQALLS